MKIKLNHMAFCLAVILIAGRVGAATLIMLPAVVAKGPQVLLHELVQDNEFLPMGWGNRAVITAPEPGKAKQVPITAIAYALQQYPDMSSVTLRGTTSTTVRRASASLESERIVKAIEQYAAKQEQWRDDDIQVSVDNLSKIENLPTGNLAVRVNSHAPQPGNDGRSAFDLTITCDGLPARRIETTAKIFIMRSVWTAAGPLRSGQVMSSADIAAFRLPWHQGSQAVPAEEDILGQELSRNIRPGQPILRHLLMEPICAKRGDLINVFAQTGGLNIRLQARALSTGRRGDRIMCMNDTSRQRILVRLTAPRAAVLDTPTLTQRK